MSENNDNPSKRYDLRRRARGVEPPEEESPWRRRLIIAGLALALLVVVVVGLVWRWSALYVRPVRAQVWAAMVTVASRVDGRLQAVNVEEGDHVEKGAELARLHDAELRARLSAARAEEQIARARHNQARARLGLTERSVEAEIALAEARVEVARAHVAAAETALEWTRRRTQEEIRRAEARLEQARAGLARLQKGARPEEIEAARARVAAAEAQQELYETEVEQSSQLVEEGIDSQHILQVKRTQLTTQRNRVREAEQELKALLAGATEEQLREARSGLAAHKAQLALARAGLNEVRAASSDLVVRRAELVQAQARLANAKAGRARIEIAREEATAAKAELEKARNSVAERRAALEQMSLVSSVNGTVLQVLHNAGEVCTKGAPVAVLADDEEGRWIRAYVHEKDADQVKVGQPAEVEVVPGSGNDLKAEVEAISPHTTALDVGNPGGGAGGSGGEATRLVRIRLRLLGDHKDILPGNSASATIRVR